MTLREEERAAFLACALLSSAKGGAYSPGLVRVGVWDVVRRRPPGTWCVGLDGAGLAPLLQAAGGDTWPRLAG